MPKMNPLLHGVLLISSIALAYWWLQVPSLQYYSLQVFALTVVMYFVVKKLGQKKAKLWQLIPSHTSLEMIIATFAFMLLIGATGNLDSPFYALSYVHLFLLVFTTGYKTSSITTAVIMLFHVSLTPGEVPALIANIASLPIVFFFFLFAKSQYDEVIREKRVIANDELAVNSLEKEKLDLQAFVTEFIHKKILQLKTLSQEPQTNKQAILGQLSLIEIEIERKLSQLRMAERTTEKNVEKVNEKSAQ
jgi:hypothetical protein